MKVSQFHVKNLFTKTLSWLSSEKKQEQELVDDSYFDVPKLLTPQVIDGDTPF